MLNLKFLRTEEKSITCNMAVFLVVRRLIRDWGRGCDPHQNNQEFLFSETSLGNWSGPKPVSVVCRPWSCGLLWRSPGLASTPPLTGILYLVRMKRKRTERRSSWGRETAKERAVQMSWDSHAYRADWLRENCSGAARKPFLESRVLSMAEPQIQVLCRIMHCVFKC